MVNEMLNGLRNLRQLERILEVARKVDDLDNASLWNLPALARICIRSGLNLRVVHSLHAIRTPNIVALSDERRSLTYLETDREICRMANALSAYGVSRGTAVVIALENSVEYMVIWFALLRLGARAIHASWRLKSKELAYILEHSGARLVVAGPESFGCARDLQKTLPSMGLRIIHCTEETTDRADCIRYDRLLGQSKSDRFTVRRHESSESIVYTSGTTGRPKGAMRDLGSLNVIEFLRVLERLPMQVHDRQLIVTPLYHSAAQAFALMGAAIGCTQRIEKHFDPARTLQILQSESIHTMFAIPTMLRRMVETGRAPQLPTLRAVISGAGEFPQPLREEAIRFFGPEKIFDFYGATELGWVTLIRGDEMLARPGSVGKALAGQEVAIFDEKGTRLGPDTHGMVYVRNQQIMGGYLNDTGATEALKNGSWMTVDDLGTLDRDGYLYLSGRARDMVKSGGVNIYPIEVEEALLTHPNIREVAVIGLPDKDWGERLVAVVVPRQEPFDPESVDTFLRSSVASFKIPKQWEVVSELPRNALGKVLKAELRERYKK